MATSSRKAKQSASKSTHRVTQGHLNRHEVVVVTGGTAGVGRATAREFARHGAAVAVLARGQDRLDDMQSELKDMGAASVFTCCVDMADADEVEAAVDRIERELGPIDVWVNNAMATIFAPIGEIKPEEFARATEVTYLGTVWGTMAALKRMRPRNHGTIVQVGSALAYRSIPLQAPYCGAKHAIRGFTDSLRTELIHDKSKVHLTMVQLPAHNTPQFDWGLSRLPNHPQPVPPIYQPEVAARSIRWAARHRRREVFVGYPTLVAIYGNRIAPWFADWYLGKTGYKGQQTSQHMDPDRPSNLFEPVSGHIAAHGGFDAVARDRSMAAIAGRHRLTSAFASLTVSAAAIAAGVLIQRKVRS